jgi:hypothetical protein
LARIAAKKILRNGQCTGLKTAEAAARAGVQVEIREDATA